MKGSWYRAHLNDFTVKCYDTAVTSNDSEVIITVSQSMGWSIHQPFAKLNVTYSVGCKLNISCTAEFPTRWKICHASAYVFSCREALKL